MTYNRIIKSDKLNTKKRNEQIKKYLTTLTERDFLVFSFTAAGVLFTDESINKPAMRMNALNGTINIK